MEERPARNTNFESCATGVSMVPGIVLEASSHNEVPREGSPNRMTTRLGLRQFSRHPSLAAADDSDDLLVLYHLR